MHRTLLYWLKLLTVNLVVAAVLSVLALLCLEAYLRATIPSSSNESIYESTLATRRFKVMKRDARIIAWGSEFRTNKLGFRDSKSDVAPKQPSEFRIIVLGDSFTASAGVDFDQVYTSLLEQNLKQLAPDTTVMNLAVGGYNIIQYELLLNEVGLSLQPNMVIVSAFPYNDLSNDTYTANFEEASGRSKPTRRLLYRDLYVYRAFLARVESRIRSVFLEPAQPSVNGAQDVANADANENLAALKRLIDTAAAHGIQTVVALLPNTDVFEQQRPDFVPFESACIKNSWRCINLLDRFMASGDDPKTFRLNLLDGHPNASYNARVAQYLTEYVMPLIHAGRQ